MLLQIDEHRSPGHNVGVWSAAEDPVKPSDWTERTPSLEQTDWDETYPKSKQRTAMFKTKEGQRDVTFSKT
jgi:hypothetical protein